MADDDVVDDVQGATVMTLTSAARAAEVLLRSSQDRALREAHEHRQASEEARRRYDAQASVAEVFYRQAADPEYVRVQAQDVVVSTWRGAQECKDFDPERFGPHADRITQNVRTEYGIDLDDVAARLGDRDLAAELGEMRVQRTRGVDEDVDRDVASGDPNASERDQDVVAQSEPGVAAGLEYDSDGSRHKRHEQIDQSDLEPEVKDSMKLADMFNGRNPAEAGPAGAKGRGQKSTKPRGRGRAADVGLGR